MFKYCTKLVGGNSTTFSSSATDATRARIDGGEGNEGYFAYVRYAMIDSLLCDNLASTIAAINTSTADGTIEVVLSGRVTAAELGKTGTSGTILGTIKSKYLKYRLVVPVGANLVLTGTDCQEMFANSNLLSADLRGFNTEQVTSMSKMFYYTQSAQSLDLSGLDTRNVTTMSEMFVFCASPTLDLGSFNTSNVTDMSKMFSCSSATTLNVSSFNTENVTDMSYMFSTFDKCETLDVSNFNTGNVTDMKYMFYRCTRLEEIKLGINFTTGKVTDMSNMFAANRSLTTIYTASNADWSNTSATSENMFSSCTELVGGNGTKSDTSSVIDAARARVDGLNGQPGYFTAKPISYYITPGLDDYTGHTGLTAEQALPNIDSALARISGEGLGGTPYFLKISGGLTGQFAIGDSLNGKARRIVLEGVTGNTVDSLYGDNAGSVLTIATTVPVEIHNLKITGGNAASGAGVYVDNGDVTIDSGTLIANNKAVGTSGGNAKGGGIYVGGGSVRMADGIISGNQTAATAAVNNCGAGVYINEGGSFTMDGGAIIDNTAKGAAGVGGLGGGVFVSTGSTFRMNAGTISGNNVEKGIMSSGTEGKGVGVYVVSNGTFIMSGTAQIASNNDVYLRESSVITIASVLDNMYVGTITPQSYPESYSTELSVFAFADGVDGNQGVKFKVTPEQRGGKTYYWYTNGGGKISKDQCRINVPNDAAHPYVLTYDPDYKISSASAGHPEVFIAKNITGVTNSLSYYVTLDGFKRISPEYNNSINIANNNSGVKFYYHITLDGDNTIQANNRAPLFYEGPGDAELIFDATSSTGGTFSSSSSNGI